jgi:1-acyl-sn-glycerol-3-phosphate acyltransferase
MNTRRSLPWRYLQILARVLTTLMFDLKVYGRENVPEMGGVLIVSNHQSYLDPVLLAVRLDRPLNYIAKSELFENQFGGWFLRSVLNAFSVRQGHGDVGAVKETIRRLHEGHALNIFPEGGRSEDGEIATLQKGVALIVRRAGVPIVPAVIVGSFRAWPITRKIWRDAPIRVCYGPPMNLAGLDRDQIIATIDRTLREMFEELSRYNGNVPIPKRLASDGCQRCGAKKPRPERFCAKCKKLILSEMKDAKYLQNTQRPAFQRTQEQKENTRETKFGRDQ